MISRPAQLTAPPKQGLYDPQFEHEACGVGFVVNMKGRKSHTIVQQALQMLVNLDHRGACGCEVNTGDGAGILMQTPHEFLQGRGQGAGFNLPAPGEYGVGMLFMPHDAAQRAGSKDFWQTSLPRKARRVLGWRTFRRTMPRWAKPPWRPSRS